MTMCLPVLEVFDNNKFNDLGEYEFSCIPRCGDRIVMPYVMGDLATMEVLYIEHTPIPLPRLMIHKNKEPSIKICVEYVEIYSG